MGPRAGLDAVATKSLASAGNRAPSLSFSTWLNHLILDSLIGFFHQQHTQLVLRRPPIPVSNGSKEGRTYSWRVIYVIHSDREFLCGSGV
jgi:hypothetical protein